MPPASLEQPRITRVTEMLPAALLAALVVLEARAGALVVTIGALLLRAPFIVVVVLAAFTAAVLRLLGWY